MPHNPLLAGHAYLNGRFLPQSEAHLPLHDAGFVMGATVTDLCRTFGHKLFRLSEHLARFRRSCQMASIPQPVTDEELTRIAQELVAQNTSLLRPEQDFALVMAATPGPVGYYLGTTAGAGAGQPTLLMHTFPLPFDRYARYFEQGVRLVTPTVRHVPTMCVDRRIKQRSRLHWWLAEQEVHRGDATAHALLLDELGHVTETAAANFLIVQDGSVLSPPAASILGGISLRTVREFCGRLNIPFLERELTITDCLGADEAFLTSTTFCIAGVSRLNDRPLPWPGSVQTQLLNCWSQEVGCNIPQQILTNR
jgi:branched-chain amino acid aminotransferase